MTILANRKAKTVTLHFNANATTVIAGNNSVSGIAIGDEEIVGATILQIWYGTDAAGHWVVKRANSSTNTIVGVFAGADSQDFGGDAINIRPGDDLRVELNGAANGFIMLELRKIGNNNFNKV